MNKIDNSSTLQRSIIGVDLGQAQDYTAISILEQRQQGTDNKKYIYLVRYLERIPLGTSYPRVIQKVTHIYNRLSMLSTIDKKPVLVLDVTGVGRPIFDSFVQAKLNPIGISIHGGNSVSKDEKSNIHNVPKRDLAGVLQILYQNGRIKVSSRLKDASTLNNELLNFKVKINISGHDSYEAWRERTHDDLVLSVACAAWYGERSFSNTDRFLHNIVSKRRW